MIPSIIVAGSVLIGFSAALLAAGKNHGFPGAIVAGAAGIAFGGLFATVGVIA